jgi:cyclomaltodextrinase / maltogenic alpha-amylase / neopullulanase
MMNNVKTSLPFRICLSAVFLLILLTISSYAQGHPQWSYNLGIYEVNVRQYTEEGTFTAFAAHLDRLQQMGVGILWFMPIHPIGEQNRLGSLGSYYSVKDYLSVNPEFGTLDDFKSLVQEVHERGMYVIMDWVANHTAWDNPLTIEHPEWYSTDNSGNFIAPPGTNWSDVIQLDYSQQDLRDYMINALKFWVQDVGVDGFRFDAVSKVPKDFWQEAFGELVSIKPDLFMLAEAEGREWHDVGFDMTYGWKLYGFSSGVLKRIADGTNTANDLNRFVTSEKSTYPDDAYRMYFTSNHDENSWQGTTSELFGDAAEVFAVLTATINGMPLIYSGQEAGLDKRLKFFDKDQIVWRDHKNADLYTKLLRLKKENQALWNGDKGGFLKRVPTTDDVDVYAFIRSKEDDKVLVAMNLSDEEQTVTLNGSSFTGSYRDVMSGETAVLAAGAVLTLPAWGYIVYEAVKENTGMMDEVVPDVFALGQNYPNPFNSVTRIPYSVAAPLQARLTIFDVLGRVVHNLVVDAKYADTHEITFNAGDLPSGIYFYRLQAGDRTETKRLLLMR